jgi:hypothetical protein
MGYVLSEQVDSPMATTMPNCGKHWIGGVSEVSVDDRSCCCCGDIVFNASFFMADVLVCFLPGQQGLEKLGIPRNQGTLEEIQP